MLAEVYQEKKVEDDDDDGSNGFQDSPLSPTSLLKQELRFTSSHYDNGFDIGNIKQAISKYRLLSNVTIGLLIVILTPILLSVAG